MIPRAMLVVAYAAGRASHARQVKGDNPDKKEYTGSPGWGLGVRITASPRKKYCYETSRGGQGPPRTVEPMMVMMVYGYKYPASRRLIIIIMNSRNMIFLGVCL